MFNDRLPPSLHWEGLLPTRSSISRPLPTRLISISPSFDPPLFWTCFVFNWSYAISLFRPFGFGEGGEGGTRRRGGENVGSAGRKRGGSVECRSSRLFVQLIQRDQQVGRERDPGGTIRESFGVSIGVLVQVDSYDSETHCPPLQARSVP